jgi:hypothetical protein
MGDPARTVTTPSQRGRLGALAQHARHDTKVTTAKARATFLEKFVDQVDPGRVLPEEERDRRAEAARRLYFGQLAIKSAKARRT